VTFTFLQVLSIFISGLAIGCNIGVLLACILKIAAPEDQQ
jgi:hypothetical protein